MSLTAEVRELTRGERIRILNDHLRTTFTGGRIMLTAHIAALDPKRKARVLLAARTFNRFDDGNDPHHEHDLGTFQVDGDTYIFKIDYFDRSMEYGSNDPGDPDETCRVICIMHASDY